MRIVRLPREEYEREHPGSSGYHYTDEEGEHIVVVPKGTSTKSMLHEIGHAQLGHETVPHMTMDEWAKRELSADRFTYDILDKDPSWDEILWDFIPMVEEGFDKGYSKNDLFNFVRKECSDVGYVVEDEEKSIIWAFVKRVYKSWKK